MAFADAVMIFWQKNRRPVLLASAALLALAAALKLGSELYRLIWMEAWHGAIDLRMYHNGVRGWFEGKYVYTNAYAAYPPATYVILWPFLGWLEFASARLLWAASSIAMLAWLAWITARYGLPRCRTEMAFLFVVPFALNATGVTIGNGQLIIHILPPLLTGLLLLRTKQPGLQHDVVAALLLAFAMVKPTIAGPFLWLSLFLPGRLRPAVAVAVIYALLTFFGLQYQSGSLLWHFSEWLARGHTVASVGGYADLHTWMKNAGLIPWVSTASIALFFALGVFLYFVRRADFWLLAALCAIAARFWTIHRFYDNVLLLIPLIALFRSSKSAVTNTEKVAAAFFFAANLAALLLPASFSSNPDWRWTYTWGHPLLWFATFAFLTQQALSHKHLPANSIKQIPGDSADQMQRKRQQRHV